jgi:hypothetical protein
MRTQYKNIVSEKIEFRKLPKSKFMTMINDFCYFFIVYLIFYDAAFPDEIQRFYVFPDLNISSIFSYRVVLLFDIRGKIKINNSKYSGNKQIENDIFSN